MKSWLSQTQQPNWKQLSWEMKKVVLQHVIHYFIPNGLSVERITPVRISYAGMNTDTFEIQMNQERYMFIPGQKECVLGWDSGLSGLHGIDCSADRQEIRLAIQRYVQEHLSAYLFKEETFQPSDFSQEILTKEYVEQTINQATSPLRVVDIPAMFVQVSPTIAGYRLLGSYNTVSGEMLQSDISQPRLHAIQQLIVPDSEIDALWSEYPKYIKSEDLFMKQSENEDLYDCFVEEAISYNEIKEEVQARGFTLLTEDEWEYCCGGGTRRLFRWGNQLQRSLLLDETHSPLWKPNMFGLHMAGANWGSELITENESGLKRKGDWLDEQFKAPVLNMIAFSSYYRPRLEEQWGNDAQALVSGLHCYRHIIRVQ